MSRRSGTGVRALQKAHVKAREDIERKWYGVLESDASYADLVTGEQAKAEPYHRWLPFRQQFGPGLVRRFLAEAAPLDPILDPFSGSGTVAIECARARRSAVGVEAIPVLAWLTAARFDAGDDARLAELMMAARAVTGEGRRKVAAPGIDLRQDVEIMIATDRARALAPRARVIVGDARHLPIADGAIGGVLTSPPYLSKYDYARITGSLDAIWRRGRPGPPPTQLRATLRSPAAVVTRGTLCDDLGGLPEAAIEAVAAVKKLGRRKDADVIRAYFDDLMRTLSELFRVTKPGAPVWIVIGAADFQREYVPADLITAEMATASGFEVSGVIEARRLRSSGRLLGGLKDVAPRESIVRLRHPVS
jgi:DNA modification methylase